MNKYWLYAVPPRESGLSDSACAAQKTRPPRRPVYTVAALLLASDWAAPLSCAVRDISEGGARLEIERERITPHDQIAQLPEAFSLYFCPDKTEVECRLAWQDGRHFGVEFLGPVLPSQRHVA